MGFFVSVLSSHHNSGPTKDVKVAIFLTSIFFLYKHFKINYIIQANIPLLLRNTLFLLPFSKLRISLFHQLLNTQTPLGNAALLLRKGLDPGVVFSGSKVTGSFDEYME